MEEVLYVSIYILPNLLDFKFNVDGTLDKSIKIS